MQGKYKFRGSAKHHEMVKTSVVLAGLLLKLGKCTKYKPIFNSFFAAGDPRHAHNRK